MSAIFKKFKELVAVILAIAVAGLAACSSSDSTFSTNWTEEVAKAGFGDPVVTDETAKRVVVLASAGTCRLRFVVDVEASRLYVTIPGQPLGDSESFVGDPSVALLRGDERFVSCFSEEKQG